MSRSSSSRANRRGELPPDPEPLPSPALDSHTHLDIVVGERPAHGAGDEGWPDGVDDVVVMLDANQAFTGHPDADVYWGAYIGSADEILAAGPVAEVADEITGTRAAARERHGWIMDTYLLRKRLRDES